MNKLKSRILLQSLRKIKVDNKAGPEYFVCIRDFKEFGRIYTMNVTFCVECGNYIEPDEDGNMKKYNLKLTCKCDRKETYYNLYRSFLLAIPDDFSGDELEDIIEFPESTHPSLLRFVYNVVLFGMIYKNDHIYSQIDENIKELILSFL